MRAAHQEAKNAFDHVAENANENCSKCEGTGYYQCSAQGTMHFQPCPFCCKHGLGWFKLEKHFGKDNGKWACRAGCGRLLDQPPKDNA